VTAPKLLFLDTETGGLSVLSHALVEVAWAIEDGPVNELILSHNRQRVSPEARAVNGYDERGLGRRGQWASPAQVNGLRDDLKGATIVASNPGFDVRFLIWNGFKETWSHRTLDVEAMGWALGFRHMDGEGVPSLGTLAKDLHVEEGPIHTAAGDVVTLRNVYRALMRYSAEVGVQIDTRKRVAA
jgi:hypothetical protein